MEKLEFFMPMIPPTHTHQEKQVRVVNGKPVFYEPQEMKAARAIISTSPRRWSCRRVRRWTQT